MQRAGAAKPSRGKRHESPANSIFVVPSLSTAVPDASKGDHSHCSQINDFKSALNRDKSPIRIKLCWKIRSVK
jgi:hypothetical protein